jgi:hypothetical protein
LTFDPRINAHANRSLFVMSEIALADLLEHLEGIGARDIRALAGVGIDSVEDLEGCCEAGSTIAALSRRTGIPDARLRGWLGRPLLDAVAPAAGTPDARVVLRGANLGDAPDDGRLVLFQGRPAAIEEWSPERIVVRMPGVPGRGMLFAVVGGDATNAIEWQASAPALVADAIEAGGRPLAGEPVTLRAHLRNDGSAAAEPFDIVWEVGDLPPVVLPHGALEPGQRSQESTLAHTVTLPAGAHVVRLHAGDATAELELRVTEPRELVIGLSDPLCPLDPAEPGPAGASRLAAGPFEVAERVPGGRLVLRARPGHRPAPRLDRIVILALAPDALLAGLEAGELDVVRLPCNEALEHRLRADGRWTVVRLPSALDVQSRAVCERDAAAADGATSAHLWNVRI